MKLLNNLYSVSDAKPSDEGFSCLIRLNEESSIYDAHFPGNPITPGACIIAIAQELYEQRAGRTADIVRITNVKFLSVIKPDTNNEVLFSFRNISDKGDGNVGFNVTVSSGDTVFARLTLICRPT